MFEQFIRDREESRELTNGTAFEQNVAVLKKLRAAKLTANDAERAVIDEAISSITKKEPTSFLGKLKSQFK